MASTHTAASCPFCDLPEDRVFAQDELAVALWDRYPVCPGHALIIPRRHIPTWFDATEPEQSALLALVNAAKPVIDRRHRPDGYNIGINSGAAAGQTVFHLHIHLIPRFLGDVDNPRGGVRHVIPAKANYKVGLDSGSMPDRGPRK
jgi:ATP adenylyltransferase